MNTPNPSEPFNWEAQFARARAGFFQRGESIAEWARKHGFRPNAVYQVLNGHALPSRGQAHQIAVALGVKPLPEGSHISSKKEAQM
jgi:gp16 family phage-associated protein